MNYKIVANEEKLQEFIDFLPDLGEDQKFYISLICRKKYFVGENKVKADKGQLFSGTATKQNLINKLRRLEVAVGVYKFEDTPCPQEALAMYITPTPRDLIKATKQAAKQFIDLVFNNNHGFNPHRESLSCIQRARCQKDKTSKYFLDFDFDFEELPDILTNPSFINKDAITWIKTRGGWHALVDYHKIEKPFLNTFVLGFKNCNSDVDGDCLLPIPGTYQGGKEVKMISL